MQQARQIGKIVITYRHGINDVRSRKWPSGGTLQLPADARIWSPAACSGFGLRTAEWLASKGARHLILISRSGAIRTIRRSPQRHRAPETQGVRVHAAACDVTSRDALTGLLAETDGPCRRSRDRACRGGHRRRTGAQLDAQQMRSVLGPKDPRRPPPA
ncbi:MAG: KR domain-containing protein [Candidatus Accumulibacter delftensis]|jgi:phthiocerol/phenolphthiocerol synthesis type-I polyketide synthase C